MGISFTEMVLIAAVAVLVLGPKQAAQLAFKVGALFGKLKYYLNALKKELDVESSELSGSIKTVKDSISEASNSVKQSMAGFGSDNQATASPLYTASYKPAAISSSELLDEIASLKLEIASMKQSHKLSRPKLKSTNTKIKMRRHSHVRARA